jgi:hypothetical protein
MNVYYWKKVIFDNTKRKDVSLHLLLTCVSDDTTKQKQQLNLMKFCPQKRKLYVRIYHKRKTSILSYFPS